METLVRPYSRDNVIHHEFLARLGAFSKADTLKREIYCVGDVMNHYSNASCGIPVKVDRNTEIESLERYRWKSASGWSLHPKFGRKILISCFNKQVRPTVGSVSRVSGSLVSRSSCALCLEESIAMSDNVNLSWPGYTVDAGSGISTRLFT